MDNLIPYYVTYVFQDATHTKNTSYVCILLAKNETDAICQAGKFVDAHLTEGFTVNFYAKEFDFSDIVIAEREDVKIYNTLRSNKERECFSYDVCY